MADFAQAALNIIAKSFAEQSKPALFKRVGSSEFNVETGTVDVTSTVYKVRGVFVGYTEKQMMADSVLSGDRKLYLAAKGMKFVPENGDSVTVEGEDWVVIQVQSDPTGSALYTLQLRRTS